MTEFHSTIAPVFNLKFVVVGQVEHLSYNALTPLTWHLTDADLVPLFDARVTW